MDITLIVPILILFGIPAAVALYMTMLTAYSIIEELYMHVFKKPLYVHFYPVKKALTIPQKSILKQKLTFYNRLSEKHKEYFCHRVACFIKANEFIGKEGFIITEEVKLMVASTFVMLTFGMRKYLFGAVNKVIVYPSVYLSTITNDYHKGEFNPSVKAIVFSWADFVKGYETSNDNVNLGIHEFSHVVHYDATKHEDASAIIFARMFRRITEDLKHPDYRQKLIDSNYFRIYAYTSHFEFLAVIIEHYFETPADFRSVFPSLYKNVSLMLNHKHL